MKKIFSTIVTALILGSLGIAGVGCEYYKDAEIRKLQGIDAAKDAEDKDLIDELKRKIDELTGSAGEQDKGEGEGNTSGDEVILPDTDGDSDIDDDLPVQDTDDDDSDTDEDDDTSADEVTPPPPVPAPTPVGEDNCRMLGTIKECFTGDGGSYCSDPAGKPVACPYETPPPPADTCTRRNPQEACANKECGSVSDGCGSTFICGGCGEGERCNFSTNLCETDQACTRRNPQQACAGLECGTVSDGCGSTIVCGGCGEGERCNFSTNMCVGSSTSENDTDTDGGMIHIAATTTGPSSATGPSVHLAMIQGSMDASKAWGSDYWIHYMGEAPTDQVPVMLYNPITANLHILGDYWQNDFDSGNVGGRRWSLISHYKCPVAGFSLNGETCTGGTVSAFRELPNNVDSVSAVMLSDGRIQGLAGAQYKDATRDLFETYYATQQIWGMDGPIVPWNSDMLSSHVSSADVACVDSAALGIQARSSLVRRVGLREEVHVFANTHLRHDGNAWSCEMPWDYRPEWRQDHVNPLARFHNFPLPILDGSSTSTVDGQAVDNFGIIAMGNAGMAYYPTVTRDGKLKILEPQPIVGLEAGSSPFGYSTSAAVFRGNKPERNGSINVFFRDRNGFIGYAQKKGTGAWSVKPAIVTDPAYVTMGPTTAIVDDAGNLHVFAAKANYGTHLIHAFAKIDANGNAGPWGYELLSTRNSSYQFRGPVNAIVTPDTFPRATP